jgi:hypothetical protein
MDGGNVVPGEDVREKWLARLNELVSEARELIDQKMDYYETADATVSPDNVA